jgi:16S rRNA (adenine1518-N6/adenine1519-N6)-dimethyltransferase
MTSATGPDGLPPLRDVIERYGINAKKSLGQNFLLDLNLTRKIARLAGDLATSTVVEIGPGPGGLTRALLAEGAKRVIAVERDARCLPALEEISARYPGRLDIHAADALEVDWPKLIGDAGQAAIVANLPYGVASLLLVHWLEAEPWPPWYARMVLMFQREVAERIVATPAERVDYGRLGVLCGWRTQARILFDIPPSAFTPPPKVVSSVVEFIPREKPLACDRRLLAAVTQAAFGQRRKMLRQSLKTIFAPMDASALLASACIEPTRRAEEVDVAGFVALTNALSAARAR